MTDGDEPFPVLIVDDHHLFAAVLELALGHAGFDARRAPGTDPADVLALATVLPPGLALLDLALGIGGDGRPVDTPGLVRALIADGWTVLALTGSDEPERIAAAAVAGVVAVLPKTASLPTLIDIVTTVAQGRQPMTPAERRRWLAEQHRVLTAAGERLERLARLTPKEREVLNMLGAGRRTEAIAAASGVSVATVRSHIRSILAKLDVSSQLEAVALLTRSTGHSSTDTPSAP